MSPIIHIACSHNIAVTVFRQVISPFAFPVHDCLISCLPLCFPFACRAYAKGITIETNNDIESNTNANILKLDKAE
ncbi:MAG: hypothetical protein WCF03_00505 [Nitrososphaeraceae archaeon]